MEGCFPSKLRVWEGGRSVAHDLPAGGDGRALAGPHHPTDFAARLFASEALTPSPARADEAPEPYSLQWFLDIERQRHGRSGRWIPRLLEFAKHPGETLVGLGDGLGTDWIQYARHGTAVVVCSPSAQQLGLIRRNFELRGLSGRFLHAAATSLPLETASIDVVCVSGLPQDGVDPQAVVEEV